MRTKQISLTDKTGFGGDG